MIISITLSIYTYWLEIFKNDMQIHIGHKMAGIWSSYKYIHTVLLNMMHWLAHSLTHLNTHTSHTLKHTYFSNIHSPYTCYTSSHSGTFTWLNIGLILLRRHTHTSIITMGTSIIWAPVNRSRPRSASKSNGWPWLQQQCSTPR